MQVAIDTGLKSGKFSFQEMSPAEACELAERLLTSANIVRRVNSERNVVVPGPSGPEA